MTTLLVEVPLEEEPLTMQVLFTEVSLAIEDCLRNAAQEGLAHKHISGVDVHG